MATDEQPEKPKTELERHIDWIIKRLKAPRPINGTNINGSDLQLVTEQETVQTVRTLRTKALFLYMLTNVWNTTTACRRLGIGRTTYYRWVAEDANFKEIVEEVEDMKLDFVEDAAMKKIGEGCSKLIEFYLRTKGKKRGFTEEITSYENDTIEFTLNIGKKKLNPPQPQITKTDEGTNS